MDSMNLLVLGLVAYAVLVLLGAAWVDRSELPNV